MIAALFVHRGGVYFGRPDVDPWDEARDARLYAGPHPVVAHPPCSRWCRLAGLVEARWGHKRGDDGGCFASALASVRRWGGVLEHPAYTDAFAAYGLPAPPRAGWQRTMCGGAVAHVEQGRYGHVAKKATWLYAYGVELPTLRWGSDPDQQSRALVSWCGNHVKSGERRPRVGKAAAATPPEFAELLVAMAKSVGAPSGAVPGGGSAASGLNPDHGKIRGAVTSRDAAARHATSSPDHGNRLDPTSVQRESAPRESHTRRRDEGGKTSQREEGRGSGVRST